MSANDEPEADSGTEAESTGNERERSTFEIIEEEAARLEELIKLLYGTGEVDREERDAFQKELKALIAEHVENDEFDATNAAAAMWEELLYIDGKVRQARLRNMANEISLIPETAQADGIDTDDPSESAGDTQASDWMFQ